MYMNGLCLHQSSVRQIWQRTMSPKRYEQGGLGNPTQLPLRQSDRLDINQNRLAFIMQILYFMLYMIMAPVASSLACSSNLCLISDLSARCEAAACFAPAARNIGHWRCAISSWGVGGGRRSCGMVARVRGGLPLSCLPRAAVLGAEG